MPLYQYQCPRCGQRQQRLRPHAEANDLVECYCISDAQLGDMRYVPMVRVPSAPHFVVNGYNAKNGYSK